MMVGFRALRMNCPYWVSIPLGARDRPVTDGNGTVSLRRPPTNFAIDDYRDRSRPWPLTRPFRRDLGVPCALRGGRVLRCHGWAGWTCRRDLAAFVSRRAAGWYRPRPGGHRTRGGEPCAVWRAGGAGARALR